MIFGDPRWLWALLALPLLALLEWLAARRRHAALGRLVGTRLDGMLLAQVRPRQRALSALLRIGAIALLIVGAARPEWGREVVRRGSTGSDVVLVVDVSASMDARDVPPSRLDEARREALAVIDRLAGSRFGVVAFAGEAIRLCPPTLDRAAARLTIEGLSSLAVAEPGTDLGKGLRTSLRLLPNGRRDEQVIVLWTDGEDLEQGHGQIQLGDWLSDAGVRPDRQADGTTERPQREGGDAHHQGHAGRGASTQVEQQGQTEPGLSELQSDEEPARGRPVTGVLTGGQRV